jgi:hypothetical protein
MLLMWNGRSVDQMLEDDFWEHNHPDAEEEAEENGIEDNERAEERFIQVNSVLNAITRSAAEVICFRAMVDYHKVRELLVTSFTMQHRAGLIVRARSKRLAMTMLKVLQRVEVESYWSLTVKPSSLSCRGENIGEGLFAGMRYLPGARIVYFRGDLVPREVYDARENRRYGVQMGVFVIDCYRQKQKGVCKASFANSPRGCVIRSNPSQAARANTVCKKNLINRYAYLEATRIIEIGEEILWDYGEDFLLAP